MKCKIIGCGGYLPERVITNTELSQFVDTNDEWIRSRTGILQRHIASDNEHTSHLALKAAKNAILDANINENEIDLIINCTTTPDNSFPSVATKLQGYLNLNKSIPSFDLQAVCAGFIYGLHIANSFIVSGQYDTILLLGSEKMSSLLNWNDRATCVLFGDGAGAVILQKNNDDSGIIDSKIYSDGSYYDLLYTDGGVSSNQTSGKIVMKGPELFRHAIEKMADAVKQLLEANNIKLNEVTYFIPHQANIRIIDKLAEALNFDPKKIVTTVQKHANCSAASIPLALNELKNLGRLKKNDIVLFTAIGGGLTWGATVVKW